MLILFILIRGSNLSVGDVYNHKYEYITDNSTFTNMMASPKNFFYGDTLVPYDKVTKEFDISKLPSGLRAFRLKAQNV